MSKVLIESIFQDAITLKQAVLADQKIIQQLLDIAERMLKCHQAGGTLYMCGNGGSACDAMHFSEELVARYKREREGIRAMHFMDPSMMTCWSNDYEYEGQFARYADVFCGPNDILFGFSTSGNSANVCRAVECAKSKGSYTVGMAGRQGGTLAIGADTCLIVPGEHTERIQEVHITFVHILCELVERRLLSIKD